MDTPEGQYMSSFSVEIPNEITQQQTTKQHSDHKQYSEQIWHLFVPVIKKWNDNSTHFRHRRLYTGVCMWSTE